MKPITDLMLNQGYVLTKSTKQTVEFTKVLKDNHTEYGQKLSIDLIDKTISFGKYSHDLFNGRYGNLEPAGLDETSLHLVRRLLKEYAK